MLHLWDPHLELDLGVCAARQIAASGVWIQRVAVLAHHSPLCLLLPRPFAGLAMHRHTCTAPPRLRLRAGGVLTKASLNAHWTEAAAPHITSPMTCIRPKSIPWRYPCRTCGCLRPFTSTTCQTDTLQLAQIDLPAVSRSCAGAVGGQEPLAMWTCCTPWVTVDVGRGLCAGFISCPRTKPGPLL